MSFIQDVVTGFNILSCDQDTHGLLNTVAKKITKCQFLSPVKEKIAISDIGDTQPEPSKISVNQVPIQ